MEYKDYKNLNLQKNDLIRVKVHSALYKNRRKGFFVAETLVTGYSLYSGCEAIKFYPDRKSFVKYYNIIPICEIQELNILKRKKEDNNGE